MSRIKSTNKYKELDDMFSQFVRRRAIIRCGGCERCGAQKIDVQLDSGTVTPGWKQLDCAHLISRVHKGTRWDADNALGLCSGCHFFIDREPESKIEFAKSKLGEEIYELLRIRAMTTTKVDLAAVRIYLKQLLEKLEHGTDIREG